MIYMRDILEIEQLKIEVNQLKAENEQLQVELASYSQIEQRLMAYLSGYNGLLGAFVAGEDIHLATATEVFGVDSPEAISAEQRRLAKAINFGLIYNMSILDIVRMIEAELGGVSDGTT